MNSETNQEQINNETARNVNQLPGVDIPQDKDDIIKPTVPGEDAGKTRQRVNAEVEKAKPKEYKLQDFSGINGPFKNFKFIRNLQDIADYVLYGVDAPVVSNHFKIINHVLDPENKRPCIGISYEVQPYKDFDGYNAGLQILTAKENMADPTFNVPLEFIHSKVNEYLQVKRVKEFSQTLVTNLTILVSKWLGEGARDNRASAANTAANSVNMMPVDIDTNIGLLDTYTMACYLYNSYQRIEGENPDVIIVNIKDYIAYRNTTQPTNLPADTPLLRLSTMNNNNLLLGKLCIFHDAGDCVIIDYDNSVTTPDNYNGLACKRVAYQNVDKCDPDIGLVLDRSLDKQTIQLSLFMDLFYLPISNVLYLADQQWRLKTYKVPTQEALLRIFAAKENEPLRYLCDTTKGGIDNYKLFYSYRIFKTMFAQECAKQYGVIAGIPRNVTVGEDDLPTAVLNEICPGWEVETWVEPTNDLKEKLREYYPTFIPYEMFLQNMAPNNTTTLTIDSEDIMTGVEGNPVNLNFKFPQAMIINRTSMVGPGPDGPMQMWLDSPQIYKGLGNMTFGQGIWQATSYDMGTVQTAYCMCIPDTIPKIGVSKKRMSMEVSDRDRLKYRKNNPYRQNRYLSVVENF